jgi:hypothetical protein
VFKLIVFLPQLVVILQQLEHLCVLLLQVIMQLF